MDNFSKNNADVRVSAKRTVRRHSSLQDVLIPMVTPMFENGDLDIEGMQHLAHRFLQSPYVNGVFALGATGEFMHLNGEERRILIRALGEVPRKGKVIAVNIGGLAVAEIQALAEYVQKQKLDVVTVVVPDTVANETGAIYDYYREIGNMDIPFIVYWTPQIKTQKPTREIVAALMEIPTFVGIKDSSRNMEIFASLCALYGEEISIFQGVEMLHLPSLACGSAGIIGGGLNLYPGLLAGITQAFSEHNMNEARQLQQQVSDFWARLNRHKCFRWLCKQIWQEKGVIQGIYCRESRNAPLSDEEMDEIRNMVLI